MINCNTGYDMGRVGYRIDNQMRGKTWLEVQILWSWFTFWGVIKKSYMVVCLWVKLQRHRVGCRLCRHWTIKGVISTTSNSRCYLENTFNQYIKRNLWIYINSIWQLNHNSMQVAFITARAPWKHVHTYLVFHPTE